MKELIFIRHPETKWGKQKRYLGATDIELSEKGKKQAQSISQYLKNKKISAIFSSDLARSRQAAKIIARPRNLKVKEYKELNEINFGKWEGLTFNQIQKKYPKLAEKYLSHPLKMKFPEGESILEFKKRIVTALKKILAKNKKTVVILSHAGVNRIIICHLLGFPLSCFWKIKQELGAINIIEIHKNIHPIRDSGGNEDAQDKHISNGVNVISLINYTL